MSRELFIDWRVATASAPLARAAAKAMQAALRESHPGLVVGLYQRAGESGGTVTLMETYRIPEGISAELQTALEVTGDLALRGLCQGPRHVEVFAPVVG